jgi:hypothetical protein
MVEGSTVEGSTVAASTGDSIAALGSAVSAGAGVPAGVGGAGVGRPPVGAGARVGAVAGFGSQGGAGFGARHYSASGATSIANDRDRPFDSRMALSKMTCRGNLS